MPLVSWHLELLAGSPRNDCHHSSYRYENQNTRPLAHYDPQARIHAPVVASASVPFNFDDAAFLPLA